MQMSFVMLAMGGGWRLVLKLNFFQTLSTRVGQDFEVEVQQDFETGACSAFCRWCFVEVMKFNLGRYSEARFGQDFEVEMPMFVWDFEVDAWSRFWRWNLMKICVRTSDMTKRSYFGKQTSTLGSVVQCFKTNLWSIFLRTLKWWSVINDHWSFEKDNDNQVVWKNFWKCLTDKGKQYGI